MNRAVKTTLLVAGVSVIQILIFALPAFAQLKIGYVRPDYVLGQYQPYRDALKQVEDYEQVETEKLKNMADEFQRKLTDAQKQAPLMKEDQIAQKRDELEKEQAKIQRIQENLFDRQEGLLVKKHAELVQPIFDRFNKVLERVGQSEKYDFILNAESETQVILYADKKYDVSDQIYNELSKEPIAAAKKTPPQTDSKTPAPNAPEKK